ncbi:MAG: hypothetical protein ACK4N4_06780 [Burkholderiales bacterium]
MIKMIKINGLQYHPNRDPQVYRRAVQEPFRIEAVLGASGTARCTLRDAKNQVIAEKALALPAVFAHELSFPTPGTRLVTLTVEGNGQKLSRDLRLDVVEAAHR